MRHIIKKLIYHNSLMLILNKKVNAYLESLKVDISRRPFMPDKHQFVIIIPAYNAKSFYKKNLLSVIEQNYKHYRIVYIDDCSTDSNADAVAKFIEMHAPHISFELKRNQHNKGALANLYEAIWACSDQEIIVTLDGDDWLAHDHVLKILNQAYSSNDIWLTYGQYITYPMYSYGSCKEIPRQLLTHDRKDEIRQYPWVTSHLRTFYAALFKKIRKEDLMWQNEFARVSWDVAMMLPMLEMALQHTHFVADVIHVYNNDHPGNDHHLRAALQKEAEAYFRSLRPYDPLLSL